MTCKRCGQKNVATTKDQQHEFGGGDLVDYNCSIVL